MNAQEKFGAVPAKAQATATKPAGRKSVHKVPGVLALKIAAVMAAAAMVAAVAVAVAVGQRVVVDGSSRGDPRETTSHSGQRPRTPASQRSSGRSRGKGLIVDTGATSHMLNDRSRFKSFDSSFKPESHSMELADGRRTSGLAEGRGDAQVCLIDSDGRRCTVTLKNALYIPSFPQELFSVKCATAHGAKVLFGGR